MTDPIKDAKDLDALGQVVTLLAKRSTETYTTATVGIWKMLAGDEKWDAEKLTKSVTKIWGQAAVDATNAAMTAQRFATLVADDGGGGGP